ncbi:MAG: 5-dehydro-2-deoxygluconokinase [Acidimicrobiia bacterium]
MSHDLVTMGRVGVDLYPDRSRVPLAEVETFSRFLGGTATNVAVACARYGHRTAVITKVGDDGFGTYVRQALRRFGVDDRFVGTDPELRTPVVFCEIHPPDHFPILFYRQPKAPDLNLRTEELDIEVIAAAGILWTTGTGLSEEPSRTTTLDALDARKGGDGLATIHDLDYRAVFWSSAAQAGVRQREALARATITVGNLEECAVAVGEASPEVMAGRILDLGVEVAIVKQGPAGVSAYTADGSHTAPPVVIDVVNGLGAGDAFGGAVCHGLLSGWGWQDTIAFANAAGAYVAGQLACADAMPDEAAVRALMASGGR